MKARKGTDERSKLIRALDRITPKIVKFRDGYTCQRCGRLLQSGMRHWAHIFGRRHLTLRWKKENAVTACHECHRWLDSHAFDAKVWFQTKFPKRWKYLLALYSQPVSPVRNEDLRVILDENKIELKRLEAEFK